MTISNLLYDETSAAEYLGGAETPLSTRTLQRWRVQGRGPVYVKLGSLVRYRQSDLNLYLEENECTSTSMSSLRLEEK